jgi:ABC-type amino acid transport system permease subunit
MRTLCAATLVGEFIVIGLAALAAVRLSDDVAAGTIWWVSGTAMVLCVLLCGTLGRPGAVPLGWVLQAGLVAAGLVLPVMFFLGVVFAALWWASVHYGRRVDAIRAARSSG